MIDLRAHVRSGSPIVVLGGNGHPGGVVVAADGATPQVVAQLVRYGTGYLRVALLNAAADRLQLPLLGSTARGGAAAYYAVSVDAREGTDTGISATDRAMTIRLLAAPDATAASFTRPGHVVPVRVNAIAPQPYGLAEAALDLARLSGAAPAAAYSELVSPTDPTRLADDAELAAFAATRDMPCIPLPEIQSWATSIRRPPIDDAAPAGQGSTRQTEAAHVC